jgi:hypothetical protein
MKFLTAGGEVEAAVALVSVLGRERIAKVGVSRGRRGGPHHTSGQGCRRGTDRGHQYSRLHIGIPFLVEDDGTVPPLVTAVTAFVAVRWLARSIDSGAVTAPYVVFARDPMPKRSLPWPNPWIA